MNDNIPKGFSMLWSDLKAYFNIKIELFTLIAIEQGSKLIADIVSNTIVLFCMVMAFLASSVTLAFYLSYLLHSYAKGFGCLTLFFILLACVLLWKNVALEKFIAAVAIKRYFEKHCEQSPQENSVPVKANCEDVPPDRNKPWLNSQI